MQSFNAGGAYGCDGFCIAGNDALAQKGGRRVSCHIHDRCKIRIDAPFLQMLPDIGKLLLRLLRILPVPQRTGCQCSSPPLEAGNAAPFHIGTDKQGYPGGRMLVYACRQFCAASEASIAVRAPDIIPVKDHIADSIFLHQGSKLL